MPIQLTVLSLEFDADELPRNTVFSQDEITVGRDPINDVVLDCAAVASHHARIRIEENGHGPKLYITDLGSETGTILEDKKIQPMIEIPLPLNKRFTVGTYLIKPSELKDKKKKSDMHAEEDHEQHSAQNGLDLAAIASTQEETEVSTQASNEQMLTDNIHSAPAIELNIPDDSKSVNTQPASDGIRPDASHQELVAILVDGNDVGDLDFTAVELFTVNGTVLHKDQPLAGVQIDAGSLGSTITDEHGNFSLLDVLDGTEETIKVLKEKFLFDTPEQKLHVNGGNVKLSYRATELFTIAGKVVHKGVPMEGVEIDGGELGKTVTGADGSYCFQNVPDGAHYTLIARKGNFSFGTISAKGK